MGRLRPTRNNKPPASSVDPKTPAALNCAPNYPDSELDIERQTNTRIPAVVHVITVVLVVDINVI